MEQLWMFSSFLFMGNNLVRIIMGIDFTEHGMPSLHSDRVPFIVLLYIYMCNKNRVIKV